MNALLLALALIQDPAPAGGKGKIDWAADLATAMTQSEKDGRPVITFFTFETCHWCHKLEEACFSDAAVVEASRTFIWVWIDRDKTPEHPAFFNVNAYPSLITIGAKKEKVHRFSGYRKADAFLKDLAEAQRRFALYRKGDEWDAPDPRPESICDQGKVTTFTAPSEEIPCGIVLLDGKLWIGQRDGLRALDPKTGEVTTTRPLTEGVADLCSDGKVLYAVEHGWTCGKPIHVIDPATGKETREIVTEANKKNKHYGANGIAWFEDRLAVFSGMEGRIDFVDPKTGKILSSLQTDQTWLGSLEFDGKSFVSSSKTDIVYLDAKTGKTSRKIPVNYWIRSIGCGEDGALFLMEQPVMGYDKNHKDVRLWPRKTLIYKLIGP